MKRNVCVLCGWKWVTSCVALFSATGRETETPTDWDERGDGSLFDLPPSFFFSGTSLEKRLPAASEQQNTPSRPPDGPPTEIKRQRLTYEKVHFPYQVRMWADGGAASAASAKVLKRHRVIVLWRRREILRSFVISLWISATLMNTLSSCPRTLSISLSSLRNSEIQVMDDVFFFFLPIVFLFCLKSWLRK